MIRLERRRAGDEQRATSLELFFDLVFVFAITQVSHLLLDDVSSELDESRNQYLFEYLAQRELQCFITTTHFRHVTLTRDRVDHEVREGVISPVKQDS